MKKLCCIFNIPSLYREAIYKEIDGQYDCEWFFEKDDRGIALFDTHQLKKVSFFEYRDFFGRFYRMKGLTKAIWKRNDFDAYLMIGAPMCISIWALCVLLRVFHPKKKVFFWTHGWYGKESKMETLIKKMFYRLPTGVLLYGNYAKGLMIKEGFDPSKLNVIYNSLDYEKQLALRNSMMPTRIYSDHFGNDNPVIIIICRLTSRKKIDMLIETISFLKDRGTLYNLVIVGDGSEKDKLQQLSYEKGVTEQTWFYGPCYDEQKNAELIYNADLCVTPGDVGLTAIHSMMFGVPVITHNYFPSQGPEFEVIQPRVTGDFFEKDNVKSLVDTIDRWFQFDFTREKIRYNCYKVIDEKWNPNNQIKIISSVLE